MAKLDGRSALIVGDDAIGRGISERLSREGARVTTATESGTSVAAIAEVDRLDILIVNLLGQPTVASLDAQEAGAFRAALDRVAKTAELLQICFPLLRRSDEPRIILVGHRYGVGANEAIAPYNAAAWALNGLMRTAAVDWGQYGITTNILLPLAQTPELGEARVRRSKIIDLMTSQLPLGRCGDPVEDVGGAALFLASPDARFVNGQVVHADGGQHIAAPVLNPSRFA